MYLEISYESGVLMELPLNQIGDATNLQQILERLFWVHNEEYGLVEIYGSDDEGVGCFVTDLAINAIYS